MNDTPPRPQKVRANQSAAAPKADLTPTPSQEVISSSRRQPATETDPTGRVFKVKYLTMLDKMRITRVLGAELSKNDSYTALASLAFTVIEIDGDAIAPPVSVREVEVLVERIGEEGAQAINKAYLSQGWIKEDQKNGSGEVIDTAKN